MDTTNNNVAHWTYAAREESSSHLLQGDVLQPTDDLLKVLRDDPGVHPYFANPSQYPLFMILTQSCDLVRRLPSNDPKSPYISLCAVRYARRAVDRKIEEERSDPVEIKHSLCHTKYENGIKDFVRKLLNNNASGYFYLHDTGDYRIPEPMCAFLPVSIALKKHHYDVCLEARVISLNSEFRSKLGWLIGDVYSRVATRDWVNDPTDKQEQRDFDDIVVRMVRGGRLWADGTQTQKLKQVIASGEIDGNDPAAMAAYLEANPTPKKTPATKVQALGLLEARLKKLTRLKPESIEKVMRALDSDIELDKYLK